MPGSGFASADVPGRSGDAVSALPWHRGRSPEHKTDPKTFPPFLPESQAASVGLLAVPSAPGARHPQRAPK